MKIVIYFHFDLLKYLLSLHFNNILKFRIVSMSHTANYIKLVKLWLWQNHGFGTTLINVHVVNIDIMLRRT